MHFDFHIQKIDINFKKVGTSKIDIILNGNTVDNLIDGSQLQKKNTLEFFFTKDDASDISSFAELTCFRVNDGDFLDKVKPILYTVDNEKHPDAPAQIEGNLYFGYVGRLTVEFSHRDDDLARAAWLIADKEFEEVKWPLKEKNYRNKTFDTIRRDARYMYTGSLAPADPEVNQAINSMTIGKLRMPLNNDQDRALIENWINASSRIQLQNFDSLPHFTYSNGILDSLNSFILSNEKVFMSEKMYYFHGEILKDKTIERKDLFSDELEEDSLVLIELPSPWYTTSHLMKKINEANEKRCRVALDLTWMPASLDRISLDLKFVDQVFFSMNKTWPIHDLRPAFRWSKQRINDSQTFQYEYSSYPKVGANVLMKLIKLFPFDYAYDKYKDPAEQIRQRFDLEPTSVLWFTKNDLYQHDAEEHISKYYHLDDFVCIRKLLDFKDKYFW